MRRTFQIVLEKLRSASCSAHFRQPGGSPTLLLILLIAFSAAATAGKSSPQVPGERNERVEVSRCVTELLPEEFSIYTPGNPPSLGNRKRFGAEEIKVLDKTIDPKIAELLRAAGKEAMRARNTALSLATSDGYQDISFLIYDFVAARAGDRLGLSLCGDPILVGEVSLVKITHWFAIAKEQIGNDRSLISWFAALTPGAQYSAGNFMLVAFALETSGAGIRHTDLVEGFREHEIRARNP